MEVIDFNQVSKAYKLGNYQTNLRETIISLPKKILNRKESEKNNEIFWALDNVSFKVKKEEVVGIIGHNGAGKSTILKLLSKVTYPTSGKINIQGRVAALIELGAGFHPDLSGRENVYLNASVLGLKRKEVDEQFDSIVQFAELERFIDTPIKRYSSGMYVRLAFAVAAHIKADVLLIDEVLSVGDMSFQQKSMAKMNELRNSGTTIVFISHNLTAIKSFCDRVILLNNGKIIMQDTPIKAVEAYNKLEYENRLKSFEKLKTDKGVNLDVWNEESDRQLAPKIKLVEILNKNEQIISNISQSEPVSIRCHFQIPGELSKPICSVRVKRRSDYLTCFTSYIINKEINKISGNGFFSITFQELRLTPGVYVIETKLYNFDNWDDSIYGPTLLFTVDGRLSGDDNGTYQPFILNNALYQNNELISGNFFENETKSS